MIIHKDLVAASATPIILAILLKEDTYGYAIIRKVQEVSQNEIAWTDGMLYPVLHRLEASECITSYWRTAETGRRRKYYHITTVGVQEYELLTNQWSVVHRALQRLAEESLTN